MKLLPVDRSIVYENTPPSQEIDHPQPLFGQDEAGVHIRNTFIVQPQIAAAA